MTQVNRRQFMQMASAAGLAPALPALNLPTGPAPHGAQTLWTSLTTHAGATPTMTGFARAMGMPPAAAKGIYANLMRNHVIAAQAAQIARVAPQLRAASLPKIKIDLDQLLAEADDDAPESSPKQPLA